MKAFLSNAGAFVLVAVIAAGAGLYGVPFVRSLLAPTLIEQGNYDNYHELSPNKITLYTVEWCDYCKSLKKYLDENDIPFKNLDVEKNEQAKAEFDSLEGTGYPLVIIENTLYRGYLKKDIEEQLKSMSLI